MLAKQKRSIERLRRVQEFLGAHTPPESPGYTAQKKALDEVVTGLNEFSIDQVVGRRLGSAEVARTRALMRTLRREHLTPITEIARANLADAPGIEKALKLPKPGIAPTKLLAEANGMRTAAALYEQRFIEEGLPPDFLKQLDAAIAAITQSISGKAQNFGRQVGGREGMNKEIKRGRKVVTGLDAIVKRTFRDHSDVLAQWRLAKRLRGAAGSNGASSVGAPSDATPVIAPTPSTSAQVAGRVA
jgi:hypothetical protein